eukprot:XP_016860929.1 uncharacterized protein LOC105373392 [Homo sapiens]
MVFEVVWRQGPACDGLKGPFWLAVSLWKPFPIPDASQLGLGPPRLWLWPPQCPPETPSEWCLDVDGASSVRTSRPCVSCPKSPQPAALLPGTGRQFRAVLLFPGGGCERSERHKHDDVLGSAEGCRPPVSRTTGLRRPRVSSWGLRELGRAAHWLCRHEAFRITNFGRISQAIRTTEVPVHGSVDENVVFPWKPAFDSPTRTVGSLETAVFLAGTPGTPGLLFSLLWCHHRHDLTLSAYHSVKLFGRTTFTSAFVMSDRGGSKTSSSNPCFRIIFHLRRNPSHPHPQECKDRN